MRLNLTLIQNKIGYGSPDDGIQYLEKTISKLPNTNNRIILLPELWISGFNRDKLYYHAYNHKILMIKLQILCKKFNISLAGTFGDFHNQKTKKLHNSFVFISPKGKILSTYSKMHLFSGTSEAKYFVNGNSPTILNYNGIKIGFAICYDIRFPELFRFYAINGVDLVLVSACFPKPRLEDWRILLKARALENQIFISAVNAVGQEIVDNKNLHYFGHSMVIHPKGKILTELRDNEEIKSLEIDIREVSKTRSIINYLRDIQYDSYCKM